MCSSDCVRGGAHCGACHRTFVSVKLFDQHRVGRVERRYCDPLRDGRGSRWHLPFPVKRSFKASRRAVDGRSPLRGRSV